MQRGIYQLIETKNQTKILILDAAHSYAWINALGIGEILVATHKAHKEDYVIAKGNYRVYNVKNEKQLTDLIHLELSVGLGQWQGYVLPTGLPTAKKKRNRIIPTDELITIPTQPVYSQAY